MSVWSSLVTRLPSADTEWVSQLTGWASTTKIWMSQHKVAVSLAVGATGLVAVTWWLNTSKQGGKLPPGPWGFPIVGAIHQLGSDMYKDTPRLRKKYGDVFSMRVGSDLWVFLCGYAAIKEALIQGGANFAGRMEAMADKFAEEDDPYAFKDEIFFANYSEKWKAHKKFAVVNLRKFGFGLPSLEPKIHEVINKLTEQIRSTDGEPFDPKLWLQLSMAKIVAPIVFAGTLPEERLDYEKYVTLLSQFSPSLDDADDSLVMMALYFLPEWLGKLLAKEDLKKDHDKQESTVKFFKEHITWHKETLDPDNPRDMLDMYLIERPDMKLNVLCTTLFMLQFDNFDTVTNVIRSAIAHIIQNPQVQSKIHEELDQVVGKGDLVSLAHKQDLPYLQAAVLESYRYFTPGPLSAPHAATRDAPLQGYVIPKGTIVIPDLNSVHYDEKIFPNPDKFDPGHFLNKDGEVVNSEYCIPFSVGRRMCLGESLAKMEVFLFIANLFQDFELSFAPDAPPLEVTSMAQMSYFYKPFNISAKPRK